MKTTLVVFGIFVSLITAGFITATGLTNHNRLTALSKHIETKQSVGNNFVLNPIEQLIYECFSVGGRGIVALDNFIPFFPSALKVWWWNPAFIQILILMIPTIALTLIVRVSQKMGVVLIFIYLLWLIPLGYLWKTNWDSFVVNQKLDLVFPWSSKFVWMSDAENSKSQFVEYEYRWRQHQKPKKTAIRVSCLGHYRLSVNGQRLYHGPMFGVLPKIYFDEVDVTSKITLGENRINIICAYVDGITHEYPNYPRQTVLVGGQIEDGWFAHNLADERLWRYSLMPEVITGERLFNAGYVETHDLTRIETPKSLPTRLKLNYDVSVRPLPPLHYESNSLTQISPGVFDMGVFSTGYLTLDSNLASNCQMNVVFGVHLDEKGFPIEYMNQRDVVILPEGSISWEQTSRRSGRYIGLQGDCDPKLIALSFTKVSRLFAEPNKPPGLTDFDNKILEISLNSLRNNIQDHIEDSVDREKATYLGDAVAVAKCLLATNGNEELIKFTILQFAQRQNENGSFPSMAPSGNDQFIPSYSLQWPTLLDEYLSKTNDVEFAKEMWPHLQKLLDWANKREGWNGFFYNKFQEQRWWEFVDWTPLSYSFQFHTPDQFWYIDALRVAAKTAALIGENPTNYNDRANSLKSNLYTAAFDSTNQVFYDSFSDQARGGESLITNALAGYLEMFPSEEASKRAIDHFRDNYLTFSPFSESWVVDWMISAGRKDLALKIVRQYWGGMVNDGSTSVFEKYKPKVSLPSETDVSYSHAWGCGPVYQYPRIFSE